jgi:hypothetical protein
MRCQLLLLHKKQCRQFLVEWIWYWAHQPEEWLCSCVHAREAIIVSTCTCTSWHDCAHVCIMHMCRITIICTYAHGHDCV